MRIDRAGLPFILLAAVPALIAWALVGWPVAAALAVLPVLIALFFRDPDRLPVADSDAVLAPADGKVMFAGPARAQEAPPGDWLQVTIFLSLFDVHINRTPVPGRVTKVDYQSGGFLPAYRDDAHANERSEIWIQAGPHVVVTRQVVGLLARRVVCRVQPGDDLAAGARIGLMKFGSRMDVFVPTSATLLVSTGATVRAGRTIIARLGAARS